MNTWNCSSGLTISIGIGVKLRPGASVGTTNRHGLSLPVFASSARDTTRTFFDSSMPEM